MRAVATVVMNRVNVSDGEYARISQGGNIRNIIFQQGQFDCATDHTRLGEHCFYRPTALYSQT